ncbi:epoxide hydrolase family protein [Microbacterium sp. NPDC091313]
MDIRPFRIDVSDPVIADLRDRLRRARLLPDSPRRPRTGMTAAYLADLVASWIDVDWREREEWLNSHPQFTVDLDGARLHFVHRRARDDDAPALLVMHGWPHTFAMQLDFADLLPDFHVVVPSLPGFGFSSPYPHAPMTETRLASTMHRLMTDVLGYEQYVTYGEDVSANVNDLLASRHPDVVRAVVVTHAHFATPEERARLENPAAVAFFARLARDHESEGGYGHIQATRPDTLAAALNDSPVGLLAWLVEKFVEWADVDTDAPHALEATIARERLLTEAMIYWVTSSIGTSFRPYYEGADTPEPIAPTEVPAAVFIQRHEADYPEVLAREFYRDLRVFERLERGGHFTIAEQPQEMAERVRAFVRTL